MDETEREKNRLAKVNTREQIRRVAHDYDNVLTIIAGSIELALRRIAHGDPEDAARQLQRAKEAIKRGTVLSANLVASTRSCDEATP